MGSGGGVGLGGGQCGCERRIEVFKENSQKKIRTRGGGIGFGGQGGCERRMEVFVKIQNNWGWGVGLGGGGSRWM